MRQYHALEAWLKWQGVRSEDGDVLGLIPFSQKIVLIKEKKEALEGIALDTSCSTSVSDFLRFFYTAKHKCKELHYGGNIAIHALM